MQKFLWTRWVPLFALLMAAPVMTTTADVAVASAPIPAENELRPAHWCPNHPGGCSDCYLINIPLPEGGTQPYWDCLSLGNGTLGWQQCFRVNNGLGCLLYFNCDVFGPA